MYRYDVSFFKCGDEAGRTTLEGSHPPVTNTTIRDVDPDTNYTVQVRVTVLIRSEPEMEFANGPWSEGSCQEAVGEYTDVSKIIIQFKLLLNIITHLIWIIVSDQPMCPKGRFSNHKVLLPQSFQLKSALFTLTHARNCVHQTIASTQWHLFRQ